MKEKKFWKCLGLMSGTSLDGLDLALCTFDRSMDSWDFEIISAETHAYSDYWRKRLTQARELNPDELNSLNNEFGEYLGRVSKEFLDSRNEGVDFISSHGHTVFHEPQKGLTLQIGNGRNLADRSQEITVCDFRTADVKLGGQGAPLVPIGDKLLFSEYTQCVNLGGFANVSTKIDDEISAFDICPVNVVLNGLCRQLGKEYDEEGKIAASGRVNSSLLHQLNELDFYDELGPKSLGLEWVNENITPVLNSSKLNFKDVIATYTEHAAMQIADALIEDEPVLISGGGAYNKYLMRRIHVHAPGAAIEIAEYKILEFKEALIFAFMGVLKSLGENNCLASVTGASKDHCSGRVYTPK